MTKLVYQFINAACVDATQSATSDWHFQVMELEDGAVFLSEGKIIYTSPRVLRKKDCDQYITKFEAGRGNKDA
tara:strand:+ start:791 stop:1009 length:219 start_codon:yes stop_codon:yes gene_type:complete